MPFDPTQPVNGILVDADFLRGQLNALNDKIDAVPAGPQGPQGAQGNDGPPGVQGPPFANAVVDTVSTLNPGDPATVATSFDGSNVHFTFGIPQGTDGPQGATGEVSNATLATAIAGTSAGTNAVATLDIPFTNDPLSHGDGELLRAKINELILAQRR